MSEPTKHFEVAGPADFINNRLAQDFLEHCAARTSQALSEWLDRYAQPAPKLHEAMRYSLESRGKRIRPALVLASNRACGGAEEQALPAACAIEMVHTFSLIHDDLPGMDNDDLRRGVPTNHKVFGEGMAILAGDGLLSLAFELLSEEIRSAELAVALIGELARATGPAGMIGGQAMDLEFDAASTTDQLGEINAVHEAKTAALIRCACRMGGLCGEADEQELAVLGRFGHVIGLAFQVGDDLLDVTGSHSEVGKRTGKDVDAGKPNYVHATGVERAYQHQAKLLGQAVAALEGFGNSAELLTDLGRMIVQRRR